MGTRPRRPSLDLLGTVQRLSLLVMLFSHLMPLVAVVTPAPDTLTLLQFKRQLAADPSGQVNNTWNANNLDGRGCPLQSWYGVLCSGGTVISVNLENLALQGELKSGTLGNLSGLRYLSLANNSLKGTLPDDLGNLSILQEMYLSDNYFEGTIPRSFERLSLTLKNLSLAGNWLSGNIPEELGDMNSLTWLDLSRNRLTGTIPASLVKLQLLVALNLSANELDGNIPSGFSNLVQLKQLDFHQNQLSGNIDPTLLTMNNTKFVDLSSNSFTGVLPWQLTDRPPAFPNVEHVNLSHNKLTGSLRDAGFNYAGALRVLDISHNELGGELPSFAYVTALTSLRLGSNAFTGSVPLALISNPSLLLEDLDISGNQLSGSIEKITSKLLKRLNLANNNFTGKLPEKLGECESVDLSGNGLSGDLLPLTAPDWGPSLKWLDLSSNQLGGMLPEMVVTNLYRLTHLNLSHNKLTGRVPPELSSESLKTIDLSFNLLEGDVPPSLFQSSISDLLLSNNRLTGPIPLPDSATSSPGTNGTSSPSRYAQVTAETATLSPLEVLDLSANNLSDDIPDRIGAFVKLRILKLSSNHLTGTIPELSELTDLHYLDLSRNQLSGRLPNQLPSSLVDLNLSYNQFTGPVPVNLTRFGQSAFFPGNEMLSWPLISPPPGHFPGQVNITRSGSKMSSAVKAGLIGGCTAGAALVVGACLFIYFRNVAKSNDASPVSEFNGSKGFERCGRPGIGPTSGFDADVERGTLSSCAPVASVKGVATRRTRGGPSENGSSPDMKMEEGDITDGGLLGGRNHRLPPVTERGVLSPEHPLVTKVSPEHPNDLKCTATPAHLVGDVYFLDKSVTFCAEDLSSAPAEMLGKSSHGTSYKAILDSGHVLTVKWLKEGLAKCKREFAMEARKFGKVKHQNIVSLRGYYWGPLEYEKLLLSDYVEGGSLAARLYDPDVNDSDSRERQGNDPNLPPDLINATEELERTGRRYPPLTWHQRLQIAVDLARGLMYLHVQHRWAHGNLKATNVLLREEPQFQACLSDFSLHRLMTSAGTANQLLNSGALGYRAPELTAAKKPKPSLMSDVFSFGVILMELITGKSAGDIISGNSGVVDLPDWVRLVANEGHAIDCYDTALVGVDRDLEPPKGIEEMLTISLNCVAPQSSRRSIRVVYDELAAINPD